MPDCSTTAGGGDTINNFLRAIDVMTCGLEAKHGLFVGAGYKFLGVAMVLSILVFVYQWWVSGSLEDLLGEALKTAFLTAIPAFFLVGSNWTDYGNDVTGFFTKTLASAVSSGGSPGGVVGDMIKQLINAADFREAKERNAARIAELNVKKEQLSKRSLELANESKILKYAGDEAAAKIKWDESQKLYDEANVLRESINKLSTEESDENQSFMAAGFKFVYSWILKVIVWIATALLVFGIIATVYMPIAAMSIGLIFGPLIIAWLPFKPMADMTKKWISFMIANGLTFVVSMVILSALIGTVQMLTTDMMAKNGAGQTTLAYGSAIIGILASYFFTLSLVLKADNMASGMTGGVAIGDSVLGRMMAGAAGSRMVAAAGGAALGHAKAAQGAASTGTAMAGQALGGAAMAAGAASGKPLVESAGAKLSNAAAAASKAISNPGEALKNAANKVKETGAAAKTAAVQSSADAGITIGSKVGTLLSK